MNYQLAYLDLAAQVRRLGIVADVQIDEHSVFFGENHDERQMRMAVLATVSVLNQLTLQLRDSPPIVEHDPYECRKCGGDCVTDAASGIRVCVLCGEGQ